MPVRRLVIIGCMIVFFFACTKEYTNPIPSYRVLIEADLTFRDRELTDYNTSKIFTSKNTVHGKEYTGYGGVLVTHTIFGEYKAFDLACPHEVRRDAVVEIDEEYNAVCKVCGSKYEVSLVYGSGACIAGPSKYPLRPYHTEIRGNILIVRN